MRFFTVGVLVLATACAEAREVPDAGPSCRELLTLDRARLAETGVYSTDFMLVDTCWSASPEPDASR